MGMLPMQQRPDELGAMMGQYIAAMQIQQARVEWEYKKQQYAAEAAQAAAQMQQEAQRIEIAQRASVQEDKRLGQEDTRLAQNTPEARAAAKRADIFAEAEAKAQTPEEKAKVRAQELDYKLKQADLEAKKIDNEAAKRKNEMIPVAGQVGAQLGYTPDLLATGGDVPSIFPGQMPQDTSGAIEGFTFAPRGEVAGLLKDQREKPDDVFGKELIPVPDEETAKRLNIEVGGTAPRAEVIRIQNGMRLEAFRKKQEKTPADVIGLFDDNPFAEIPLATYTAATGLTRKDKADTHPVPWKLVANVENRMKIARYYLKHGLLDKDLSPDDIVSEYEASGGVLGDANAFVKWRQENGY